MNAQRILDHVHAQPFRRFTLRTSDGQAYHVPHPDFLATRPDSFTVTVYAENDRVVRLNIVQIHAIETTSSRVGSG